MTAEKKSEKPTPRFRPGRFFMAKSLRRTAGDYNPNPSIDRNPRTANQDV